MSVPLLDLRAQYACIKSEIDAAIADVFDSQRFVGGPHVEALEEEIARYIGAGHALGVASGTDALLLSLRAADIGPGDEVITSPFTFFATPGAIHNAGATPVFVDIKPDTFNIDPARIEAAVTERTRAIVPVHLFGQCADMEPVLEIAARHDLLVIEDAAQSLAARYQDRMAGTLGQMAATSFFPSKNLGGAGDGGMITTNDPDMAHRIRLQRNHGQGDTYVHHIVGTNSRLDAIQAAVVRVKLRHLDAWTQQRRRNAAYYTERLAGLPDVVPPVEHAGCCHVYNQYTIRVPRRDEVLAGLRQRGIGCAVYYPLPLHLQACFAHLGYEEGAFPEAERASREVLSVPVYPELSREQQDEVIDALAGCLSTP